MDLDEFQAFLDDYHQFIDNFYFSLPMGDKFHARKRVAEQFHDFDSISLFWDALKLIKSYGIKLEVVFNTYGISRQELLIGKDILESHEIGVDLIGIVDYLYEDTREIFPFQKIVHSFNNFTTTLSEYEQIDHQYDEYVIGRNNIRNIALFNYLKNIKKSQVVLLLNNGCSFTCGGCSTLKRCHKSYYNGLKKHSPEYLYSLQSIMPYEIHSELLNCNDVALFKISSRNSDISYLRKCIESYINGDEYQYLSKYGVDSYYLWGRLAWHEEFYDEFDLDRIKHIKSAIYSHKKIYDAPFLESLKVGIDFCEEYIFNNSCDVIDFENLLLKCKELIKKYSEFDAVLSDVYIGTNKSRSLEQIDLTRFSNILSIAYKQNIMVNVVLPDLVYRSNKVNSILKLLKNYSNITVVVNDKFTMGYVTNNFNVKIACGLSYFDKELISAVQIEQCSYNHPNNRFYGQKSIPEDIAIFVKNCSIEFCVVKMPHHGICIPQNTHVKLRAVLPVCIDDLQKCQITQEMYKTIVERRLEIILPARKYDMQTGE